MKTKFNSEKNGIEISFDCKPEQDIIDGLKANGFRWSPKRKIWYAKYSEDRKTYIKEISNEEIDTIKDVNSYDIWELTRTGVIENNFEKYKIYNTAEIAKRIKSHLKERFPFIKWSFTSGVNSIRGRMTESPFDVDEEIMKAIVGYAYEYSQSWNYNNSDVYSDYFDVNFYGCYGEDFLQNCKKREANISEINMLTDFNISKAEYEKKKAEQEEKEFQEYLKRKEVEEKERKQRELIRKENHDYIESSARIVNMEYYILNCKFPSSSKLCKLNDYKEYIKQNDYIIRDAKIVRDVWLNERAYNLFINNLMEDYDFLAGMGGSHTEDLRIQSMTDYNNMTQAERNTVKWIGWDCIRVLCEDNEDSIVINPEGFNYARYVYIVDDNSKVSSDYNSTQIWDKADYNKCKEIGNLIVHKFQGINEDEFQDRLLEWLNQKHINLTKNIIRTIDNDHFKTLLYEALEFINGIQYQFEIAGLTQGQKITIVHIDGFYDFSIRKVIFDKYEKGSYAQYKNAINMTFKPIRKRSLYNKWYYSDIIIYDGWLDCPEDLFYNVEHKDNMIIKKSKYGAFDVGQCNAVLQYFKKLNIEPIINTYKA